MDLLGPLGEIRHRFHCFAESVQADLVLRVSALAFLKGYLKNL